MNKLYRILIQIFIVTLITVAATNAHAGAGGNDNGVSPKAAPNYNPGVIQPYAKINGKTYGDWGTEWWKWALSVPFSKSVINDPDGGFGSQNQKGAVWFLAGNNGGTSDRTITIPAGKLIFFPLFTYWNDYPCPDPNFKPAPGQSLEDFLTLGAASVIDPWVTDQIDYKLSAMVDDRGREGY